MQIALIPPKAHTLELRGDLSLCLYHELRDHSDLRDMHRELADEGVYTILDNSAHELGRGLDVMDVYRMASDLGFDEIVLPDSLDNKDETLELSIDAMARLKALNALDLRLMIVPQAKTVSEYGSCLRQLVDAYRDILPGTPLTIGISKDYETFHGGLPYLFRRFIDPEYHALQKDGFDVAIHLLGWGRDQSQLSALAWQFPYIRSTDSAKPIVYALNNIELSVTTSPRYPGRPADYFLRELTEDQYDLAVHNARVFWRRANPGVEETRDDSL